MEISFNPYCKFAFTVLPKLGNLHIKELFKIFGNPTSCNVKRFFFYSNCASHTTLMCALWVAVRVAGDTRTHSRLRSERK